MDVTCAVLIKVGKEFLVCHPTFAGWKKTWSLPKGIKEPAESETFAAIREVFEETGISLIKLAYLGKEPYTNKKDFILFISELESKPTNLQCISMFMAPNGKTVKEIDKFAWITFDKIESYLNKSQCDIVKKLVKEF